MADTPAASDFAVTRSIDGGEGLNVTASAVTLDSTKKIVTLTVGAVAATSADQSVVYNVSYKTGTKVAAPALIVAKADTIAPTIDSANSAVTDYQTLTVAFSEAVAGTPSVTLNSTAQDASNLILAADGKSLAIKNTAGFNAGTYTIVVNGLADKAGNAMAANAQVILTKATSYVADFSFTTTGLDATPGVHNVYFKAFDQYKNDVTASLAGTLDDSMIATGTMGQLPLAIAYAPAAGDNGHNYFTLNDNLIEGQTVTLTLKNTVSSTQYTKSITFTVAKASAAVPTSIASITPAVGTSITVDNDNQVLTLSVLDQYGNPVAAGNAGNIRWVTSNKTAVAFTGNTTADFETTTNALTNNIDALAPGTASISVFLAGSTTPNATLNLTVAAASLSALTWSGAWDQTFNQEVSTEKNSANAGAVVTAADLKYMVDSVPAGASASDLSVTFTDGTAADAGKVLVKATTAKAGTYQFRVYKGASVTAPGAVVAPTKTLTTTVNPAVASIEVAAVAENELTAGNLAKKAVTFKNAHGEVVAVNAANLTVASTANMAVTAYDASDNVLTLGTTATPVAKLGFTATAAGTDTVTIVTGSVSKQLSLTTAATATLTSFALASNTASVIINDIKDIGDATATDNVMLDDGGKTVVLIPVTFYDQYGNTMTVNSNQLDMTATGAAPATVPVVALYGAKADGTAALADGAATAVKYIGVRAETGDTTQSVSLQMRNEADTSNIGQAKIATITVNAARALNSISVAPTSGSTVVGAAKTFTLSGVDQYGAAVNLDDANTQMVALANVTLGGKTFNAADANKSDFALTAATAGQYTATIFYSADGTLDAGEKSTTVTLNAAEIGQAINSIAIQPTATITPNGVVAYSSDLSKYKAQITEGNVASTYALAVKAFDAANSEVAVSTGDIVWTVVSNTLKEGNSATTFTTAINSTSGLLTVTPSANGTGTISGTVVVRATSLNGKTSDFTLNFDSTPSAGQAGTYYLAASGTPGTALTSIALDKDDTNGYQEVVLSAADVYGKVANVTENDATVTIGYDSAAYFTKAADSNSINLTAKAAGTTNLRIFVNGTQEVVIPVTVTQDSVNLVAADALAVATDKAALTEALIKSGNADLAHVSANLADLTAGTKATGAAGSTILWSATTVDTATIAANGAVTRSAANDTDDTVVLTATLTKGTITDTKTFNVTLLESKAPSVVALSTKMLTDTTIQITFSEAVTAVAGDFTDLKVDADGVGGGSATAISSISGSGTTTIVLTVPAIASYDAAATTATVDIAATLKDTKNNVISVLNDQSVAKTN